MQYLKTLEPPEEVCIINDIQKRGTTFPISIESRNTKIDSNALMDTGATRSCMNYSTAYKLGNNNIKQFKTTQVVGGDGSDLGAVSTLQCKITIGDRSRTNIYCMLISKRKCHTRNRFLPNKTKQASPGQDKALGFCQ